MEFEFIFWGVWTVEEVFVCMFKFIRNEEGSLLTFNHHSNNKKKKEFPFAV